MQTMPPKTKTWTRGEQLPIFFADKPLKSRNVASDKFGGGQSRASKSLIFLGRPKGGFGENLRLQILAPDLRV
jgi:hypothetical protein